MRPGLRALMGCRFRRKMTQIIATSCSIVPSPTTSEVTIGTPIVSALYVTLLTTTHPSHGYEATSMLNVIAVICLAKFYLSQDIQNKSFKRTGYKWINAIPINAAGRNKKGWLLTLGCSESMKDNFGLNSNFHGLEFQTLQQAKNSTESHRY
jgi:hypothetical protein